MPILGFFNMTYVVTIQWSWEGEFCNYTLFLAHFMTGSSFVFVSLYLGKSVGGLVSSFLFATFLRATFFFFFCLAFYNLIQNMVGSRVQFHLLTFGPFFELNLIKIILLKSKLWIYSPLYFLFTPNNEYLVNDPIWLHLNMLD